MGKVPAIEHNGIVVTEAAAICAYLADEFPAARPAPPIGDPRRGHYLKWLFFGPRCLEQAIIDRIQNRPKVLPRASSYGGHDTEMGTIAACVGKGPYLLGRQFTAADMVIGAGLHWGTFMTAVPDRQEPDAIRLVASGRLERAVVAAAAGRALGGYVGGADLALHHVLDRLRGLALGDASARIAV